MVELILCNPMVACVSKVRCYEFAYNNTSTTITIHGSLFSSLGVIWIHYSTVWYSS
jgi:hypothetical protein